MSSSESVDDYSDSSSDFREGVNVGYGHDPQYTREERTRTNGFYINFLFLLLITLTFL